jgi:hypothetical protein
MLRADADHLSLFIPGNESHLQESSQNADADIKRNVIYDLFVIHATDLLDNPGQS